MSDAIVNDEFTTFLNDALVAKFERFRDILRRGLSYYSEVPLKTLRLVPGSKIVDVGCGRGNTALQLARITGATGSALGLDCCAGLSRAFAKVMVGSSVEHAVLFQVALGPAGEIFRAAGEVALRRQAEIEDALASAIARYKRGGEIVMASSSSTITATHPGP
jgi:ubiquinone/menaquinone biosynthesis C-methylase UbiE